MGILVYVLPHELVLTFVAGVMVGVLVSEGIVNPRRQRRAMIWRRLLG